MYKSSVILLAIFLCAPAMVQAQTRQPRQLSAEQLAKLRTSVQKSKARSIEQARRAELQRQEQARQWEEQQRIAEAEAAWRAEQDALAEAEEEAAAPPVNLAAVFANSFNQAMAENAAQKAEQDAFIAGLQRQQAEAQRQREEQQQAAANAERRRQVELIDRATQRQYDEGERLAAQRRQHEQQRAEKEAAERAEAQRLRDENLREQAAAERKRLQEQKAPAASAKPTDGAGSVAGGSGSTGTEKCNTVPQKYAVNGIPWETREVAYASLMDHPNAGKFTDIECNKNGSLWMCTANIPTGEMRTYCAGASGSRQ